MTLSGRDRRAAVGLVRTTIKTLAETETDAPLSLKREVEQVTLQQLIALFADMLATPCAKRRAKLSDAFL